MRTRLLTGALMLAAVSVWGCESQQTEVLGLDGDQDIAIFAKGGNGKPGGGGGDGSAPPAAIVTISTSAVSNPIVCTGDRVGSGFSTACGRKSPTDCDTGNGVIRVGLIEVLERKGEMDRVIIRGQDDAGTDYETDQITVKNPHRWDGTPTDFDFDPEVTAEMTKRKGKSDVRCTVSLGRMSYDFAPYDP